MQVTSPRGHKTGSLRLDADELGRRGWITGAFFPEHDTRHCADMEVKYGQFIRGQDPKHPAKVSATTEFTLILSGSVRAQIDGDELVLSQGDYVLIHPGTPNNTVLEILQDAAILTVKAPSDPGAKQVVDTGERPQ